MPYSELLAKVHEVLEQRLKALSSQDTEIATFDAAPVAPQAPVPGESPSQAAASTSADGGSASAASASDIGSTTSQNHHTAFGNSIKNWPIFPDTAAALKRLSPHFKLVVLSNVDRQSFQHTHAILSECEIPSDIAPYLYPSENPNRFWHPQETSGSNSPFTVIATAQDTGCYKPALGGFQELFKYFESHPELFGELGSDVKAKVISVAQSLPHDHVPAKQLGIDSVWIDRQSAVTCNVLPGGQKPWTWRFETLAEFADAVELEYQQAR